VTNKQYELFDPDNARHRPSYQRGPAGRLPSRATRLCGRRLNCFAAGFLKRKAAFTDCPRKRNGSTPAARHELRARIGATTSKTAPRQIFGGDDKKSHDHWADDGYEYTAPVGSYPPNPWGLYEMIGNAREFVNDWYTPFSATAAVDLRRAFVRHCRSARSAVGNTGLRNLHFRFPRRRRPARHQRYQRIPCGL